MEQKTETLQKPSDPSLKEWLRPVEDPDLGMSLLDLGLIYSVEQVSEGKMHVKMTLTSPACPAADYLVHQIKTRMGEYPDVTETEVEIVWEPKWDPATMASEECKEELGIW